MATAVFTQINGPQQTDSVQYVDITGLFVTLPASDWQFSSAFVTLNLPAPYVLPDGSNPENGIGYQLVVQGTPILTGGWTNQVPQEGRSPFTMVANIPLTGEPQNVQAQWSCFGGVANLGNTASLSGVLVQP